MDQVREWRPGDTIPTDVARVLDENGCRFDRVGPDEWAHNCPDGSFLDMRFTTAELLTGEERVLRDHPMFDDREVSDEAALRAAVDRQRNVAQALFEQQVIRCGGRKPGDPTWDDLYSGEQDEFWDAARDAIPVIDRAIAATLRKLAAQIPVTARLGDLIGTAEAAARRGVQNMLLDRADELEAER